MTRDKNQQKQQEELSQEEIEAAIASGEARAAEELKADVDRVSEEAVQLAASVEEARSEAALAKERLARVQADWDNFRKRTAQERIEERTRATAHLVEGILPALDDMERALQHASTSPDASVADLAQGVQAVYDKLQGALSQEGVSVIDPTGEPFDPAREQAVGVVEDASIPQETVVEVLRKGYEMGGIVLREAMVSVSSGGPVQLQQKDESDAS